MIRSIVAIMLAARGEHLYRELGQPAMVDNRPGGNSVIATEALEAWVRKDIAHYRRMIELTGARPEGR